MREQLKCIILRAMVAILIIAVGIGGLCLLQSEHHVTPGLPANSLGEHDILSDPNVLWGNTEEIDLVNYIPPGSIIISAGLKKLISIASEENLIVFSVEPIQLCELQPIDITRLSIPGSLKEDTFLIDKIKTFNEAANIDQCINLYCEIIEYVECMASLEEYLSFRYSWRFLDAEWIRVRLEELGCTPCYKLEMFQGEYGVDKALTFVGTAEAIQKLQKKLTGNESYVLKTIGKEVFDQPD